jgi:hypothetical protein
MKVVFSKPYKFEGKTYDSVELSCSGLTGGEAKKLIKDFKKFLPNGDQRKLMGLSVLILDDDFLDFVAAKFIDQPLEFLEGLPLTDWRAIATEVTGFFSESV